MTLVMLAAAILVPAIFYYLTLHQTMNAIEGGNRPFPGELIWLAFVPFLGTIWYMVYAILRSNALKKGVRATPASRRRRHGHHRGYGGADRTVHGALPQPAVDHSSHRAVDHPLRKDGQLQRVLAMCRA